MNIEGILFGNIALEGELIRIIVAFIGLAIASWFDIFNKKNIPTNFLYVFLLLSVAINVLYSGNTLEFSLIVSLILGVFLFLIYRLGQIGGADMFILVSLSQLLPLHPSLTNVKFNFPFILSVFLFSGIIFVLYFIFHFLFKVMKENSKPNLIYLVALIPYAIFSYMYINSFLFFPFYFLVLTLSFISIVFFYTYRESITNMLIEEVSLKDLEEEEILALDLMNQDFVKKHKLQRLVDSDQLKKLKKLKLKSVPVYTKLPPFIPFILLGFIAALFFSSNLIM